jgi:hypothetical protein
VILRRRDTQNKKPISPANPQHPPGRNHPDT